MMIFFGSEDISAFTIIASQENEELINEIVIPYAYSKGYDIDVQYAGTLEIIQKLNAGESYDAVWLSNSIWGYMLDSKVKLSESKFTNISPIIFGIKKSKAEELGFIGKTINTQDIVNAISEGKLKFSMSNPSITNSGASAYLGMLSTLAGNPEVLTKDHLENSEVKEKLKTFYAGLERSSGSEDFLEELFLKGDYESVFTYESSIINTKHVTYYEELENSFFLREFFTKEVKGLSEEVKKRKNMVIDELRKVSMGYIAKPYFIIETAFKDARGDGIYQEKYNGKYFYHITNADKLSMITRDNLVSVRKQDINDKSDLVDEEKLKKIGGLK